MRDGRKALWKLLTSVVECQTGITMVAALPASAESSGDDDDENLNRRKNTSSEMNKNARSKSTRSKQTSGKPSKNANSKFKACVWLTPYLT